jgi:imidazoleglycerol-phosphate dehydratase/histidinol-phosphatase
MLKVLFIDRDGTLIEEPDDHQVDSLEKVRLVSGVIPALRSLLDMGYRLVLVSNQDGLGSASFPQSEFDAPHKFLLSLLASQGIRFDDVFICPHLPEDNCTCRKPATGLLTRYLLNNHLDKSACAVIGDRDSDLELAKALGIRGLQIGAGTPPLGWNDIALALSPGARVAEEKRTTRETSVQVSVNLDSSGPLAINTGIGFYDHMLEQIAKHGGFSLVVDCLGDLIVDEHHTVEDTALSIGKALRTALGEKRGIARYGFQLPMDESEASVSLDLSGRPTLQFSADFPRQQVGEFPTELVPHFFQSLVDSLGAALHISVTGSNTHHMVEACFKAVGRALRQAIRLESNELPTTKGVLS